MNSFKQRLPAAARLMLGFIFFVFGLNGFLHFIPQPPMEGPPAELMGALMDSGFIMLLVKGTETVAGLMLLSNRFVPLALALLAPIIVVIVGFHTVLAPAGAPVALVVLALELYLARAYRVSFAPMLKAHTVPVRAPESHALHAAQPAH